MKFRVRLKEDGIYPTGQIERPGDIFDVNYQELPYYRNLVSDPQKAARENLRVTIKQMTPQEYFEECAKIFNTPVEHQFRQIENDEKVLNNLYNVLQRKSKFPLTILDYTKPTQEGRHRMYVAGELYGWDKKFPVGIIEWLDKDKAQQEASQKHVEYVNNKVRDDIENLHKWSYDNFSEFVEEVEGFMIPRWESHYAFKCTLLDKGDYYLLKIDNVEFKLSKADLNIEPELDDLDIEDLT